MEVEICNKFSSNRILSSVLIYWKMLKRALRAFVKETIIEIELKSGEKCCI
jgi:hypothetical protein